MGVMIVAGTVALAVVLVQRLGGGPAARWETALAEPAGTRIAGIAGAEGGLGLLLAGPDGEKVLVVEPKTGRVIGEIRPGR